MIKFKQKVRSTKRLGIAGPGGKGKSTAITKISRKPLVFDIEEKWTKDLSSVVPIELKSNNYQGLKDGLIGLLNEPSLDAYDFVWIDSASQLYRWAEDHAIEKDYGGQKTKYSAYQTGPKHELIQHFTTILKILGDIEKKHNINVGVVLHTDEGVKSNPLGDDYDKILIDVNKNLRPSLLKWFDFLGVVYDEFKVEDDGLRKKVGGSGKRVISFDPTSPLYDAKCASLDAAKVYDFDMQGNWYRELFNKKEKK